MSINKPKSSQQANTTNNYQESTTIGQVGLSGQNAVDLFSAASRSLNNITGVAESVSRAGFELVSNLGNQNAMVLGGLTNATQDFSQRAIAAGTGQETPIQEIGPASGVNDKTLLILGTVVAIVALYKD